MCRSLWCVVFLVQRLLTIIEHNLEQGCMMREKSGNFCIKSREILYSNPKSVKSQGISFLAKVTSFPCTICKGVDFCGFIACFVAKRFAIGGSWKLVSQWIIRENASCWFMFDPIGHFLPYWVSTFPHSAWLTIFQWICFSGRGWCCREPEWNAVYVVPNGKRLCSPEAGETRRCFEESSWDRETLWWDHRGSVWLPYLLHAKDDIKGICQVTIK